MTRLILGLVVLVGILAAVAVGLPAHVTVTRAVVINAPESVVFPYLNNLHHFADWSPSVIRDPQLTMSYSGPEAGKGAQVQWTSKAPSVGSGNMEITGSDPNRHLDLVVNFNGLDGTSSFDVAPSGSGSKVTWTFGYDSGSSPLKRWKALALDSFIGAEYRTGLDRLKEKIEAERRPTAPTVNAPPEGGESSQSEQPSAALPPGAAAPGAAAPPGQAGAPAGAQSAPGGAQPNAAAPAAADATTPAPAPAPAPKSVKKRRKQQ
jgi:hypothetical protein